MHLRQTPLLLAMTVSLSCVDGENQASAPAVPVGAQSQTPTQSTQPGISASEEPTTEPTTSATAEPSGDAATGSAGTGAPMPSAQSPEAMPAAQGTEEASLFVPEHLVVENLNGEGKDVNVAAMTLETRENGAQLLAALENSGDVTACDAAVSFELFDESGTSVGSWITGLYSASLFRRSDGGGGLIACIQPGQRGMAAFTDLPALAIDSLANALYQLSYFDAEVLPFELIPVDALEVNGVESAPSAGGSTFSGTLHNSLDQPLLGAEVTIFPLTSAGRPLGVAKTAAPKDVAAGDSWHFETLDVTNPGTDLFVSASGAVSF